MAKSTNRNFLIFLFILIKLTKFISTRIVSEYESNSNTGDLKDFGQCILKFKRFSDKQFYLDLTEKIIHINRPNTLIYWIFDSKNDSASK